MKFILGIYTKHGKINEYYPCNLVISLVYGIVEHCLKER